MGEEQEKELDENIRAAVADVARTADLATRDIENLVAALHKVVDRPKVSRRWRFPK